MDIQVGKGGQRPRMLMCYLCGREFGSKSLPIHLPQCQKKWEAAEMAKHPKDRRPMPQPPAPEIPIKMGGGGAQAIDDFNEVAYEQFKKTLQSCPNCNRKFKPEAYERHSKACTASTPAKPAGTALIANSLSNNKQIQVYSDHRHQLLGKPRTPSSEKRDGAQEHLFMDPKSLIHLFGLFPFLKQGNRIQSRLIRPVASPSSEAGQGSSSLGSS